MTPGRDDFSESIMSFLDASPSFRRPDEQNPAALSFRRT